MRSRQDPASRRRRALGSGCLILSALLLLCFYYSSSLSSLSHRGYGRRSSSVADDAAGGNGAADEASDKDSLKNVVARYRRDGGDSTAAATKLDVFQDLEDSIGIKNFPVCDGRLMELVPCLDRRHQATFKLKLNLSLMEHYERHCPPQERRLNCIIPPPQNYTVPKRWPESRDEVWRANVPHSFLAMEKSDQHWMEIDGDVVHFPGGGTHFPGGADKYITSLAKMLKHPNGDMSNQGKLRNFLDVGCGVASFGAFLLDHDILTMSIAPNDVHENQIQFALERGIPSTLGVLGTMRWPYPSKSFDLAHCSRCRIDWLQRDGILLLEVDRMLRPGGYFAWSSPPAYRNDEEDVLIWNQMTDFVTRMCWKIAAKEGQTVIWEKPLTNECYNKRLPGTNPPLCSKEEDPDFTWQAPMKACLTPLSEYNDRVHGSGLKAWPVRLVTPPPRLKDLHISDKHFNADTTAWVSRVAYYWTHLGSRIPSNALRNVMDMRAHYGGFAAAIKEKPVWVMNVVPISGLNTLKVVYDRGLIGSLHDWCEAFSTYPRTFDLLHAWNVISDIDNQGCSIEDLLLEMDRILRPMGYVIIRDKAHVVDRIAKHLDSLHWNSWSEIVDAEADAISTDHEKILFAQKEQWVPKDIL